MDSLRSSAQPPRAARIAIALGDATGIGPEVALKAVAAELDRDSMSYVLLGDLELARSLNDRLGLRLNFGPYAGAQTPERVSVFSPPEVPSLSMTLPPRRAGGVARGGGLLEARGGILFARRDGRAGDGPRQQRGDYPVGPAVYRPNGVPVRTGRRPAHGHDVARSR